MNRIQSAGKQKIFNQLLYHIVIFNRKAPVIIILIALAAMIFYHPWTDKAHASLISWDKLGYYLYLLTTPSF